MLQALSPFVGELQAALDTAIRELLALPAWVPLRCQCLKTGAPPQPFAVVAVGDAENTLHFELAAPGVLQTADAAGPELALRWHHRPGRIENPAEFQVQRAVAARVRRGGALAAAAAECLQKLALFAGQDDELFRKVSDSAFGRYGLLRLGFACNQDCGFCWQGRDWPAPPPEKYLNWLDEIATIGVKWLLVTGGEPTLWPRLAELIARATGVHGLEVLLETNAIRMRQPHVIEELRAAGLRTLFVSYHSADAATSDQMTRAPRTHANTEKGIAAWLAAGLEVQLNCVVQPQNVQQLAEHGRAIVQRFVKPYPQGRVGLVTYTQPAPYFDAGRFEGALVPLDEVAPGLSAAISALLAAGVRVQVDGSCGFPACLTRDVVGVMRWQPALEMADSDSQSRGFAAVCEQCAAKPGCLGVRREYLQRFGERGLRPFLSLPPGISQDGA